MAGFHETNIWVSIFEHNMVITNRVKHTVLWEPKNYLREIRKYSVNFTIITNFDYIYVVFGF